MSFRIRLYQEAYNLTQNFKDLVLFLTLIKLLKEKTLHVTSTVTSEAPVVASNFAGEMCSPAAPSFGGENLIQSPPIKALVTLPGYSKMAPSSQQNKLNVLNKTSNPTMFRGAQFSNCTFNFGK